ncbi:hypothetical protein LIER_21387 [Lithospermum erythrorhizon]|uniref:Uncharacterized protein n=1 Tax=Lithospermum erythrorhizon TaxID=34254 RepID=A0AAV3QSH1_LITER
MAQEPPTDVVAALQRQVDALEVRVAGQVWRGTNAELAGSSVDVLFLDGYLKLGMNREQTRFVATPLVGFIGDVVSALGSASLMVTMRKHP